MGIIKTVIFIGVSLYLAFIFGMAGGNKLYPIDAGTHKYLVDASKHWPGVFSKALGMSMPDGDTMRIILGASEVAGAAALVLSPWILPRSLGSLATLGLIAIMGGAIYLHRAFGESIFFPALLLGLCVVRLVLSPATKAAAQRKKQA